MEGRKAKDKMNRKEETSILRIFGLKQMFEQKGEVAEYFILS